MMATDPTKDISQSPAYESNSNAESIGEGTSGLTSPAYSITAGEDPSISGASDDSTSNFDFHDHDLAKSKYNEYKNDGSSSTTISKIITFIESHPSLVTHENGDYRYYLDKGTNEPMLIGLTKMSSVFYSFDNDFATQVNTFHTRKKMMEDENAEKYITFKDVEITGAYKFVKDKFLWFDGTEEMEIEAFGMKKNMSSGEIEITPPGVSLGTISLDLTKPYFGIKGNLKPSINAGVFGAEFDVEKKEMGLSMGLEHNGIGLEIKVIFLVNTDKTSEDATQFICYDLLPWVGEISDALGG